MYFFILYSQKYFYLTLSYRVTLIYPNNSVILAGSTFNFFSACFKFGLNLRKAFCQSARKCHRHIHVLTEGCTVYFSSSCFGEILNYCVKLLS